MSGIEYLLFLMREAAIARHAVLHAVFENSDPAKWKSHEEMIKKFYGS